MTPEVKAAEINARAARAVVKALGMYSENMQRQARGHTIAYDDAAFFKLVDAEGLDDDSIWRMIES